MLNIVQLLKDVDVNNIKFIEAKKKAKASIRILQPTYENHPFIIQLPPIDVYGYYGVPRLDKYHTEEQRYSITLPLNNIDVALFQKLDDLLNSKLFRQSRFDKHWKSYNYIPLVKKPENRQPFIKLKIDKPQDVIKLDIVSNSQPVDVKTIDDVEAVVNNSLVSCMINVSALWIQSPDDPEPKYGLTLKAIKLKIESASKEAFMLDFI
jgi:hypothetical protein